MAEEKITPEEKLLKIIEHPQNAKRRPLAAAEAKKEFLALKQMVERLQALIKDKKELFRYLNLHMANKALAGLCGIMTLFFIFDFTRANYGFGKRFDYLLDAANSSKEEESILVIPEINIKEVLTQSGNRNIFTLAPAKKEAVVISSMEIPQSISSLKLVGIMWSDNPQVMIEDTKEQKTYLLSVDDYIGQEIKIKKILRDKVILGKDSQEWELR